jgi:hypothetical protein
MLRFVGVFFALLVFLFASNEDAAILAKLKAKMSRSTLRSEAVEYKVENGVVLWSGTVKIPQRKGAATRMAKSSGAKKVLNRIVVQHTTPRTSNANLPRPASVEFRKR